MDVEALSVQLPSTTATDPVSRQHRPTKISTSKSATKDKPANSSHITKEKSNKPVQSTVFSSMGLMSVDDLMPTNVSSVNSSSSIKSYKRSDKANSDSIGSSIHTYKESVRTQSIASEIRTHSSKHQEEYASDFDETLRETESIHTDDGSSRRSRSRSRSRSKSSYSSRFSSSTITRSRSRSSSRNRSRSIAKSTYSDSPTYTYSTSRSQSRSRSSSRSKSQSRSRSRSRSQYRSRSRSVDNSSDQVSSPSYTASFDADDTDSAAKKSKTLPSEIKVGAPIPCTDASVQTGLDLDEMILKYYWMSDRAVPSIATDGDTRTSEPTVLTDPPSVAKLVVSNEALEVLTTYSPALLALNDMIKQQVELSKQFLTMQRDMHKNVMDSIEREHTYTTLEDTKQFIKSKRKPRLTFEEALLMVKEEMGL